MFSQKDCPDKAKLKHMYVMKDDQSTRSDFFALFNVPDDRTEYTISSCTGNLKVSGRRASGIKIESLDECNQLQLSALIELIACQMLTPEVATYARYIKKMKYKHNATYTKFEITNLFGRCNND